MSEIKPVGRVARRVCDGVEERWAEEGLGEG